MIRKLPMGTRIYLTKKKNNYILCIQPDKILANDILYVKYDVKENGHIIIPKGTRVVGDWITESNPSLAAQLQVTRIYLQESGQPIAADSEVINAITKYNHGEICYNDHFLKRNSYRTGSNVARRIAKFHCKIKTLLDNDCETTYLEIETVEIPIILTSDFIKFPNLGQYNMIEPGLQYPAPINPCDPCAPDDMCLPCPCNPCDPPATCPPPTPPLGAIDPILNRGNFNQPRFHQRTSIYVPPNNSNHIYDAYANNCCDPCNQCNPCNPFI